MSVKEFTAEEIARLPLAYCGLGHVETVCCNANDLARQTTREVVVLFNGRHGYIPAGGFDAPRLTDFVLRLMAGQA